MNTHYTLTYTRQYNVAFKIAKINQIVIMKQLNFYHFALLTAIICTVMEFSFGQSHDLIIGTYSFNKTEPVYSVVVHKENSGLFNYWKKVEKIIKFQMVSHGHAAVTCDSKLIL